MNYAQTSKLAAWARSVCRKTGITRADLGGMLLTVLPTAGSRASYLSRSAFTRS